MTFEVRAAGESDRSAIAELLGELMPGADLDSRLEWLYDANPGGRALTWLATERGELAGCTSYFPSRLQLDGYSELGAFGGDGFVRPRFRRRGLGRLLHEVARDAMPAVGIRCMYGAPGAMNLTPLKHGGSREIGQVARWVRPLRGAALGVTQATLDRLIGSVLRPRRTATLEPMVRGDERVDEVWRAVAPTMVLGAVRDATLYTWRFLDAPANKQRPFVILEHGRPIGACALEVLNQGRAVRICDAMAIPGAWHRCLLAIARHCADLDAHFVDIKLMALEGRKRAMWRAGFIERGTKPFLVVIPPRGDRRFLDPQRWWYGGADTDLDTIA